jgi:hypothetical protein
MHILNYPAADRFAGKYLGFKKKQRPGPQTILP